MPNWTEAELKEFQARRGKAGGPAIRTNAKGNARYYALGRLPVGTMNKTEAAYAAHLESLKIVGEVLWYKFEAIKLRLADNTFYTCDFVVLPKSGVLEMHEIKGGFWTDDSRVKIKVAASIYPFRFIGATVRKKHGGGWKVEEF